MSKTLRIDHHIQPHWMFALDNILRDASQATMPVVQPGMMNRDRPNRLIKLLIFFYRLVNIHTLLY